MADHGIQITRTTISPPPVAIIGQGVVGIVGDGTGCGRYGSVR